MTWYGWVTVIGVIVGVPGLTYVLHWLMMRSGGRKAPPP